SWHANFGILGFRSSAFPHLGSSSQEQEPSGYGTPEELLKPARDWRGYWHSDS
ncbi:unnamed protein product, partial [Musa acuminata subsp. burmannicoides]